MIDFPCRVCCKTVGAGHRAIECDICKSWVHIKCNKLEKNYYAFHQDNPDEQFYCIKCTAENIAFSTLNDNQFDICVKKGVTHLLDTDISFRPSVDEQRLFDKLNNAINNNAFDLTDGDNEDNNDITIDCN